jgi:AcrR family transcriptional regulator
MAENRITKRKQQALNTRRKIFDTAIKLFAKKGYERVTVDDICRKAGVSKGSFYNHFKSKDQVIIEEFLKIDDYYQEVLEKVENRGDYTDKLIELSKLSLKYINDQGLRTIKVAYYSQISPGVKLSPVADPKRVLYRMAEQLVREGQEKGEIRSDLSSTDIAYTFIRCIRGIIYEWCLQNGRFDLEEAGDNLRMIFIEGLRPR